MCDSEYNMRSYERCSANVSKYFLTDTQAYLLHYCTHMGPLPKLRLLFSEKCAFKHGGALNNIGFVWGIYDVYRICIKLNKKYLVAQTAGQEIIFFYLFCYIVQHNRYTNSFCVSYSTLRRKILEIHALDHRLLQNGRLHVSFFLWKSVCDIFLK